MKKWIIGIVIAVVAITAFCLCASGISKQKDLSYYKQTLFYNADQHILEGTQVVGFYNYTDVVLDELCLHLYPNAFREGAKASVVSLANYEKAYPHGKSYGNIIIESVNFNEK